MRSIITFILASLFTLGILVSAQAYIRTSQVVENLRLTNETVKVAGYDVYNTVKLTNIGNVRVPFVYNGREVHLRPGSSVELPGLGEGDVVDISVSLPLAFGFQVNAATFVVE